MHVVLTAAEGTPQPLPGTHGVSIWYVHLAVSSVTPTMIFRCVESTGRAAAAATVKASTSSKSRKPRTA